MDRLLAEANEHLGSKVRVSAVICDVAEGGPMLFLEDGAGDCKIIVLMGGDYHLNWAEFRPATVKGIFDKLTAENVDRIESEFLDGEAFVASWRERLGYRYIIAATQIVQRSRVWPD